MVNVVVVEDSHIIQQIYRSALDGSNFNIVAEVMDGKDAVSVIQHHQPQIIILDLVLPNVNGIDVLKKISQVSPLSRTIVVTSVDDKSILQHVKNLGAIFVLSKPFKKKQLLQTLTQLADSKPEVKHG